MSTPESRVKQRIKDVLNGYGNRIYYFMPVQTGYGTTTIDFLICVDGLFLGLEAKAPGKRPTALQEQTIAEIRAAGGTVYVIWDDGGISQLRMFIDGVLYAGDKKGELEVV